MRGCAFGAFVYMLFSEFKRIVFLIDLLYLRISCIFIYFLDFKFYSACCKFFIIENTNILSSTRLVSLKFPVPVHA